VGLSIYQTMHVVVCWKVRRRWHPVADWPEIIITGLHCFCVRSLPVSNAPVLRRVFVLDIR